MINGCSVYVSFIFNEIRETNPKYSDLSFSFALIADEPTGYKSIFKSKVYLWRHFEINGCHVEKKTELHKSFYLQFLISYSKTFPPISPTVWETFKSFAPIGKDFKYYASKTLLLFKTT